MSYIITISGDTAAVAEMTADEKEKALNDVFEKATSNEPTVEHEQCVETSGKCEEPERKDIAQEEAENDGKTKVAGRVRQHITETRMFKRL